MGPSTPRPHGVFETNVHFVQNEWPMGSRVPRIRVLLIDDHEDTRDMYAQYLASIGMDVQTANDGAAGVERALTGHPHVIVMDWSMPAMTGDEATRVLKQNPQTRNIPVAILTAFGAARRAELEAAGAAAVSAKPCNPDALADLIRQLAAPVVPPAKAAKTRGRRKRVQRPRWASARLLTSLLR
jgi:two-component system, cell cycle response regulator DivK